MGLEFRGGRYRRYVRMGKRTIKDGEAAVVWNRSGRSEEILGPRLKRLFYAHIRFLERHTASPTQYIEVHNKDGSIEHLRGPATLFENPVRHNMVRVHDTLHVPSSQECIVVYRDDISPPKPEKARLVDETPADAPAEGDGGASQVRRRVVNGPARFMPEVGECVHTFEWSKCTSEKTSFSMMKLNKQLWELESEFTLADNEKATIKLTVEFQASDIDVVLGCDDPLASMRSALQADLAVLGPKLESHQLMGPVEPAFAADKSTFGNLVQAGSDAGLTVLGLKFRGFEPNQELRRKLLELARRQEKRREQQDAAEQAALCAKQEAERAAATAQAQRQARQEQADSMQAIADAEYANKRRAAEHERELEERAAAHELEMKRLRADFERGLTAQKREDTVAMLTSLNQLGLDVTRYLCGEEAKDGSERLPSMLDVRLAVAQALQLESREVGRK